MLSNKMRWEEALKPICALCRKEVDSMKTIRDHCNRDTVVLVYCHGQRRECRLSDNLLHYAGLHRGIAFLDLIDRSKIEGTVQEIQRMCQIEHQKKLEYNQKET